MEGLSNLLVKRQDAQDNYVVALDNETENEMLIHGTMLSMVTMEIFLNLITQ